MDHEINFFPKFIYILVPAQFWQLGTLIAARKPAEGALENALLDPNTLKGNFLHFIAWKIRSTTQQMKHPHR